MNSGMKQPRGNFLNEPLTGSMMNSQKNSLIIIGRHFGKINDGMSEEITGVLENSLIPDKFPD